MKPIETRKMFLRQIEEEQYNKKLRFEDETRNLKRYLNKKLPILKELKKQIEGFEKQIEIDKIQIKEMEVAE